MGAIFYGTSKKLQLGLGDVTVLYLDSVAGFGALDVLWKSPTSFI